MPVLEFSPPPTTTASPHRNKVSMNGTATCLSTNNIETKQDDEAEVDVSMEMANTQSQGNSMDGTASKVEEVGELSEGSDDEDDLPPLHVEVRLKSNSTVRYDLLRRLIATHFDEEYETLLTHSEVHDWRDVAVLSQNIERVWIGECSLPTSAVPLSSVSLTLHIYQPPSSSNVTEFSTSPHADEDGDTDVPAASVLELPSKSLEGVWDSLIYEGQVKEKLLGYIYSTMLFSDASVDFNIVTWNRVVLLHGPPGTGKTSLCRSLAQKLAIRLSERYDHGKLIEINSHSLFSKWFSESGKLVQRLFAQVTEMMEDESCFVVVLIDEVESLTAARAGAMSGKEPSDALRVVNALLTQLDKLKHRKNCLVMTTSNLSSAIDNAFIDRADIKQYIGLPPTAAVYWILQSCLNEIMRAGLIPPVNLYDYKSIELYRLTSSSATESETTSSMNGGTVRGSLLSSPPSSTSPSTSTTTAMTKEEKRDWQCSDQLYRLAEKCHGMSGRTLRRLPVLAHARHIGSSSSSSTTTKGRNSRMPRLEVWLKAMERCVEEEGEELNKVEGNV